MPNDNTLKPDYTVDGKEGTDKLAVELGANFTGFAAGKGLKGVEVLELKGTTSVTRAFNADKISGLNEIVIKGEQGATVQNLANIVEVSAQGVKATNGINVNYTTNALEGTSDVQKITLDGIGAARSENVERTANNTKAVAVGNQSIETINITTKGEASYINNVQTAANGTLNIEGSANLELTTAGTGVVNVDASALTGDLDADLRSATSLKSVKLGSGNDKVYLANTSGVLTVDGGNGDDTLIYEGYQGTHKLSASNIESLKINTIAADNSMLEMSDASGIKELSLKELGATQNIRIANSSISKLNIVNDKNTAAPAAATSAVTITGTSLSEINYVNTDPVTANTAEGFGGSVIAADVTALKVHFDNLSNSLESNTITAQKASTIELALDAVKGTQGLTLATPQVQNLIANVKSTDATNVTITNANANNIEILNISTDGAFRLISAANTSTNLTKVSEIKLSGTNANSAVTLGNIGDLNNSNGLEVNASGLQAGLTFGSVNSRQNSGAVANVKATDLKGAATIFNGADSDVGGDVNISVNGVSGALAIANGNSITSTGGKISLDVSNAKSTVNVGGLTSATSSVDVSVTNASGNVTVGALTSTNNSGDISVSASGLNGTLNVGNIASTNANVNVTVDDMGGKVTLGTISAQKAVVDLSQTMAANAVGAITAADVTYKGSLLQAIDATGNIALTAKNGTAQALTDFKANITGSLGQDNVAVTMGGANIGSVTLTGDLKDGQSLTANGVSFASLNTAAANLKTIDISTLANYGHSAIALNAGNTGLTAIKTGNGNDAIDISAAAVGLSAHKLAISAGAGDDTITTGAVTGTNLTIDGGEGNDTFVLTAAVTTAAAANVVTLTSLNTGDKITFGDVALNFTKGTVINANTLTEAANTLLSTNDKENTVYAFAYKGDTYLLHNVATGTNKIAVTDHLVKLAGVSLDSLNAQADTAGTIALTIN
ncbi:hypothetical protein [Campylobacter sp. 19-13652]|uniref:beta strand repeat-containing protein n=1 Tax=Campylobacter sp. 19-13652 TaxID=2840180 RepID=UPI001C75AD97|nr:hypothetical protein [Campylobacter sp. 19-13652]BCX79964.1 hypothetical protein LBC_14260 [Campylobacter sp. 19-13652]